VSGEATNILDRILESKRQEVEQEKARVPLEDLKRAVRDLPRPRNFYAAIAARPPRGIHIIAEIKKRSPSAGLIREDFEPVRIASIYYENGASALSVLTDKNYFDGRLEYVQQVKHVVPIPVLRKDFIVDEYQIYQSRVAGADAILLIADALNPRELLDMLILASEMYLTSIIEVHEADTVMKVRSVVGFPHERYSILGINNRNLKTQTTDLGTTGRIAAILEDETPFITESGIKTRADVERMIRLGAKGVLIGETLMKSPDIAGKMNELFPARAGR
jgi:indole-3-glycerol phosphate synthase